MSVPIVLGIGLTLLCMATILASRWIAQRFEDYDNRRRTERTRRLMEGRRR